MPQKLFATAGVSYIGAMVCSIDALQYVNFPTRELGKSCKVMLTRCVATGGIIFFQGNSAISARKRPFPVFSSCTTGRGD